MDKDDKTLLIGAALISTPILAVIIGWPALVFSAAVIASIAFANPKD